jgi:AraC-like DNA-binding protein
MEERLLNMDHNGKFRSSALDCQRIEQRAISYDSCESAVLHPNRRWTLALLGKETGVSRSLLTTLFKETLGVAPMTYLTNWNAAGGQFAYRKEHDHCPGRFRRWLRFGSVILQSIQACHRHDTGKVVIRTSLI